MNPNPRPLSDTNCTGGWGIRSSLNYPYFLTAGHCYGTGQVVFGTDGRFGGVANSRWWSEGLDSAIVAPDPNVDGWQEVPGVGITVGKMSNEWLTTAGNAVGMQAPRTGRSYGITSGGWVWIEGRPYVCASYFSQGGDSGGPVFIHYGDRVFAAGVTVLKFRDSSYSCFVTIDDLLWHWNAWLPVFNAATGTTELVGPGPTVGEAHRRTGVDVAEFARQIGATNGWERT